MGDSGFDINPLDMENTMSIYRLPNGNNVSLEHVAWVGDFHHDSYGSGFMVNYSVGIDGRIIKIKEEARDDLELSKAREGYWDLIREWEGIRNVHKVNNVMDQAYRIGVTDYTPIENRVLAEIIGESGVIEEIRAERMRQVAEEGYTTAEDDVYENGELAAAAATYAQATLMTDNERAVLREMIEVSDDVRGSGLRRYVRHWPWGMVFLKLKDRRRDLVRSGALIVAEIERLDRIREADPVVQDKTALVERLRKLIKAMEVMDTDLDKGSIKFEREDLLEELEDYGYKPAMEENSRCLHNVGGINDAIMWLRDA